MAEKYYKKSDYCINYFQLSYSPCPHFPPTSLSIPNFPKHPSGNFHKFTATAYLKLPHCIPLLSYNVALNFFKRKMYFDLCDYLIIIVHLYPKKRFFHTLLNTFIILYCYLYNIIRISRI